MGYLVSPYTYANGAAGPIPVSMVSLSFVFMADYEHKLLIIWKTVHISVDFFLPCEYYSKELALLYVSVLCVWSGRLHCSPRLSARQDRPHDDLFCSTLISLMEEILGHSVHTRCQYSSSEQCLGSVLCNSMIANDWQMFAYWNATICNESINLIIVKWNTRSWLLNL